jgi:hypothetical protein
VAAVLAALPAPPTVPGPLTAPADGDPAAAEGPGRGASPHPGQQTGPTSAGGTDVVVDVRDVPGLGAAGSPAMGTTPVVTRVPVWAATGATPVVPADGSPARPATGSVPTVTGALPAVTGTIPVVTAPLPSTGAISVVHAPHPVTGAQPVVPGVVPTPAPTATGAVPTSAAGPATGAVPLATGAVPATTGTVPATTGAVPATTGAVPLQGALPFSTQPRPDVRAGLPISAYSDDELDALVGWLVSDGQPRSRDELAAALRFELGITRRSYRIDTAVRAAIARAGV